MIYRQIIACRLKSRTDVVVCVMAQVGMVEVLDKIMRLCFPQGKPPLATAVKPQRVSLLDKLEVQTQAQAAAAVVSARQAPV